MGTFESTHTDLIMSPFQQDLTLSISLLWCGGLGLFYKAFLNVRQSRKLLRGPAVKQLIYPENLIGLVVARGFDGAFGGMSD